MIRICERSHEKEAKQKKELEEALEAAREAGMARTVFLRNMSHDICTPLNAVLGFTDLALKEGTDVSKIQEYLEKIRVSGNHLLEIVNEVLEISRIESGQTELYEEPADMDVIVEEVAVIIREQTQENPALANIPIIAVSANAFEEDKVASRAAGMNGHLAKPMDAEAVLAMMEEVLGEFKQSWILWKNI